MQSMIAHFGTYGSAILCNVMMLVIFYLVARVLDARQAIALAFGFVPILIGFAAIAPQ